MRVKIKHDYEINRLKDQMNILISMQIRFVIYIYIYIYKFLTCFLLEKY